MKNGKKEVTITAEDFSDVLAETCVEFMHRTGRDKDDMFLPMMFAMYGAMIMSKLFYNEELEVE